MFLGADQLCLESPFELQKRRHREKQSHLFPWLWSKVIRWPSSLQPPFGSSLAALLLLLLGAEDTMDHWICGQSAPSHL